MHLPTVELDKFDGNPIEYLTFIAVFDEVVDNTVMDGQIKLTMLLQYTCGSAKAAIRNCAVIGGESGYNQARANLHNSLTHSLIWRPSRVADTPPLLPISRYGYRLFVADVCLCSEVLQPGGSWSSSGSGSM